MAEKFSFEEALQKPSETFSFEDALKPQEESAWRQAADIPVGIAQGAVRGVRNITDIFGADNAASEGLRSVEDYVGGLLSAQAKQDQREVARIMDEAKDKGVWDQVSAAWEAFKVAPVDLLSQGLGSVAPMLVGGAGARAVGLGASGIRQVAGGVGAAMGAGATKSAIYEAVKEELSNQKLPPEVVEKTAAQAQGYGENFDQIALGALLGRFGATSGVESALLPQMVGNISKKLASKGVGRFAQTTLAEAGMEGLQGGQEQVAQNVGLQRVGVDTPTWQGVVGAGTLEGITGGALGAGVSAVSRGEPKEPSAPVATQTEARIQQLKQEQQSADYMREIEKQELETRKQQEEAAQIKTAEELSTKVVDIGQQVGGVSLEADGLDDNLNSLYAAKDNLTVLKQNLDRVSANKDVRQQINEQLTAVNEKIKEGQALAKTIGLEPTRRAKLAKEEVGYLPEEQRAKASAAVFESAAPEQVVMRELGPPQIAPAPAPVDLTIKPQELTDIGLPKSAAYTKQLSGLDLGDADQRTKAADIIGRVMQNPQVKPEVKEKLQNLYDSKLAAPVPAAQGALDFEAELPPAAPVAPTVIDDSVFDTLGIGKTAVLRKNADLRNADLTKPEDRQYVRNVLEMYRDAPNRSEGIKEKIDTFLGQLPVDEAPVVEAPVVEQAPEVIPEVTPEEGVQDGQPATTPTEPAAVGQPSEPSVGVDNVGGVPTATQEGAPGAVTAPESGGLVRPAARTGDDTQGVEQAPAPITTPAAPAREPSTTAAADSGLITREDRANVASDIAAGDVVGAAVSLEWALQKSKDFNIANAAQALRASGDSAGVVTDNLTKALTAQDPLAALQVILNDDTGIFNPKEQLVARRILDTKMQLPTMRMVDSLGNDPDGNPILGQFNSITDQILLVQGAADSHTFLHEMIHAFVHRTIVSQELGQARNPNFRTLQDVFNHVKETRPDLAKEYGLSSLTEFASEAMSNREFQMQLMGMPYRNQSVFSWFARALRSLLGIAEDSPQGNVLFTAMVAVDGLMRSGRELQMATTGKSLFASDVANVVQNVNTPMGQVLPTTLAEVNSAPTQVLRTETRKFMNTYSQGEVGYSTILRQQTVDIFAPIAEKLSAAFSQGVKNSFGDVNPLVWLRQANDHQRIALQMYRTGGIEMDENGLWRAMELKDSQGKPASPQMIIEQLAALAKKNNSTYQTTKAKVATVLEGMRLKELRDHNAKVEALAREQAAEGDVDKAYETRLEKIFLHMTNAEIDALVDVFNKTPEIQEMQRVMNVVRGNLIDAMVNSGRIPKVRADEWRAAVNYIPFDRLKDISENPDIVFAPGRKGIAALGKIPELKGSLERPVANAIDNYMHKLAWMTEQSMRNSAVVRTLNIMNDAGLARKLMGRGEATNSSMIVPTLYENGKPVLFEVQNQYDLAAFAEAPETKNTIIKLFAGSSRLLRTTVTATPMFAIKQVFDDAQRVMFYSGVKYPLSALGRTLINLPRIMVAKAFGNTAFTQALERTGIVGDYDVNPINPIETVEFDTKAVKRSPVRALIHAMEQVTKASDMAARLAVYEQTMKETGDSVLAQTRARELINFNRRGASKTMQTLTHVVPFFNSWAQGLDLLYRGFTGKDASSGVSQKAAAGMFISRILMMSALGTLYAMAMGDDEGYKEASDTVRDRNWILPKSFSKPFGMEQSFKIPAPVELGFLFKSIPERALQYYKEYLKGENKPPMDAALSFFVDTLGVYGNEPIPAILRPALENLTNYSFFTKRPLVSAGLLTRPDAMQYNSSTSEVARWLGKQTDVSPIKIDNFIRGYFGLMGSTTSMMVDGMMSPNRPDRGLEKLPFLSIGLMAPVGTRTKDEFYEFRDKVAKAVAGKNALKDDPEQQARYMEKNYHLLAAAPVMNDLLKTLRNLRENKKLLESGADIGMSGEERRAALLDIAKAELQIIADIRQIRNQFMAIKD